MNFMIKPLELDIIKNQIAKFCKSESSIQRLSDLKPMTEVDIITESLKEVEQMATFIAKFQSIPFIENFDIHELVSKASKGFYFSLEEILQFRLFFKMEFDAINHFRAQRQDEKTYESIFKYVNQLKSHYNILNKFYDIMDEKGEIYDKASPILHDIRKKMANSDRTLQTKMQTLLQKYQQYLSENIVVLRNDRLCLAVKESFKNKIPGVLHDMSQSKQTLYIEPEATRIITQELEHLKLQEQNEILKILSKISEQIHKEYESIKLNLELFIELDLIQAKAKYALQIDGMRPTINKEGIINFVSARHPLIDRKDVVPIDMKLNKEKNTMLITGPNTGGKTVALKTLGLLTLMAQSGILVPLKPESELAVFDQVFADIGDEQSITQSLSTFSSHIKRIIYMIEHMKDNSLVLIDEIGSGTDPGEGVSLAIAIIEYLRQYDIRMIVTTHYSELKQYAFETEGMVTASVAFDVASLKPLYKLTLGAIGSSHALLIAKRLGLSNEIYERAESLQLNKTSDLAKVLEKLNNEIYAIEQEKAYLKSENDKLNELIRLYEEKRRELFDKEASLVEKITDRETSKFKKAYHELEQLIEELKEKNAINHKDLTDIKTRVNQSLKNDQIVIEDEKINVDDQVYIRSYDQYGVVHQVKDDKYLVKFGMFELWFNKHELAKEKTKKETKKVHKIVRPKKTEDLKVTTFSTEVDLRGKRFEDVKGIMDDAIDKSLLTNVHELRIIHGFGTGAIRKAVQDYIKKSPYIKSSRYGGEGEGLNGVTIITLK